MVTNLDEMFNTIITKPANILLWFIASIFWLMYENISFSVRVAFSDFNTETGLVFPIFRGIYILGVDKV